MATNTPDEALLKERAQRLYQRLAQKEIVVDEEGVRIVMTGNQTVKEFSVEGITNATVIEKLNKALQLTQKVSADELTKDS